MKHTFAYNADLRWYFVFIFFLYHVSRVPEGDCNQASFVQWNHNTKKYSHSGIDQMEFCVFIQQILDVLGWSQRIKIEDFAFSFSLIWKRECAIFAHSSYGYWNNWLTPRQNKHAGADEIILFFFSSYRNGQWVNEYSNKQCLSELWRIYLRMKRTRVYMESTQTFAKYNITLKSFDLRISSE